jgi:hypothetical protein
MAARKATGATWAEVAAEFAVAKSTARKGVADHLGARVTPGADGALVHAPVSAGDPLAVDARDALRDALATYEWATERLRDLAANGDNSSARVGAVRAAVLVTEKRIELLLATGVIPSGDAVTRARVDAEKRQFAAAVIDALQRCGLEWEPVAAELDRALPEAVAA